MASSVVPLQKPICVRPASTNRRKCRSECILRQKTRNKVIPTDFCRTIGERPIREPRNFSGPFPAEHAGATPGHRAGRAMCRGFLHRPSPERCFRPESLQNNRYGRGPACRTEGRVVATRGDDKTFRYLSRNVTLEEIHCHVPMHFPAHCRLIFDAR